MSSDQFSAIDQQWMAQATALARHAESLGEVPVGAIIVKDNQLLGEGFNQPIQTHDPSAHAEIVALRAAGLLQQNYRLLNTTLYVTLEPCIMCIGAITHARVQRVVYGASDPRFGAVHSAFDFGACQKLNHQPIYQSGLLAEECGQLLSGFFKKRRATCHRELSEGSSK